MRAFKIQEVQHLAEYLKKQEREMSKMINEIKKKDPNNDAELKRFISMRLTFLEVYMELCKISKFEIFDENGKEITS